MTLTCDHHYGPGPAAFPELAKSDCLFRTRCSGWCGDTRRGATIEMQRPPISLLRRPPDLILIRTSWSYATSFACHVFYRSYSISSPLAGHGTYARNQEHHREPTRFHPSGAVQRQWWRRMCHVRSGCQRRMARSARSWWTVADVGASIPGDRAAAEAEEASGEATVVDHTDGAVDRGVRFQPVRGDRSPVL